MRPERDEPITPAETVPSDRMSFEELVEAAAPLLIPSLSLYGSAFILSIVAARSLGPVAFGETAVVVFAYLLLVTPATAVQAAVATDVWPGGSPGDTVAGKWAVSAPLRRLVPAGIAWAAIVLIASGGVAEVSVPRSLLLCVAAALSVAAAVPLGQMYAAGRGRAVVWIVVATAVARPVVGALLLAADVDAELSVLVALVVGDLTCAALAFASIRVGTRPLLVSSTDRFFLGGSFQGIVVAVVGLAAITTADVILTRYRLPAGAAGQYAGAAVFGRALLFVGPVAALFAMPRLAALRVVDPFRWLRRSLAVSGAVIAAIWVVITVVGPSIISGVLGDAFSSSRGLVSSLAAAAGLLAIVWQLSLFHKTVRSRAHASNYVLLVAFVLLGVTIRPTAETIAGLFVGTTAAAVLFQYQGARAICRWTPPLSLLTPHEEIRPTGPVGVADVELSMILPCRNAGPAVRGFLRELMAHLEEVPSFEVIVVSDGSTDDTLEIAREFASSAVRVFHYAQGSGKGHALRVGLNEARGEYVGYVDSDGDIDPDAIGPFLALMKLYRLDIVLGSKRHPMSEVNYPAVRRVMSWVYHKVARVLFLVDVRDTQTGFKVIRRDVLRAVLPRMLEKRYAFDLELLDIARLLGYRKVFEAPVRINYRFSSQVVPTTAARILVDTAAIFYRRYILNTYSYAGDRLVVMVPRQEGDAFSVEEV
jgi:O-antigen/teichoic acid export membrane protein